MIGAVVAFLAVAAASPTPSAADSQNVGRAMAIATRVGDSLWPNWSKVPFVIDLQTASGGILLNSPSAFQLPTVPKDMEATMVLGPGIPTVVIGTPEFTQARLPIRWTVTLLHEHFHQWQYTWPLYKSSVTALGLAPPGDTNAMWMLNYPFPYADAKVDDAYDDMSHKLAAALTSIGTASFDRNAATYLAARDDFKALLKPADYRYFAFQCWQEGTARYTEILVGRFAADAHAADPSFLNGADAAALEDDSLGAYGRVISRLLIRPLKENERSDFYDLGAGEALLLDQLSPGWRARYLDPGMDLRLFFSAAR